MRTHKYVSVNVCVFAYTGYSQYKLTKTKGSPTWVKTSDRAAVVWQDAFPGMKLRIAHKELREIPADKAAVNGGMIECKDLKVTVSLWLWQIRAITWEGTLYWSLFN